MSPGLIAILGFILFVIIIFVLYEKKGISVKEISLMATMSAIAGVSRVPFAGLPNVQPTTFLVIISGYVFGPYFGFMVGAMATIVSNSFLGHGPWTLFQMIAWGIAGFTGGLFNKLNKNPSKIVLAIFCFVWGFLFDYIMNIWHWLFFVKPLNLKSFIAVYVASFYLDLMHATGNFAFAYVLGRDFMVLLARFKQRISYTEILEESIQGD